MSTKNWATTHRGEALNRRYLGCRFFPRLVAPFAPRFPLQIPPYLRALIAILKMAKLVAAQNGGAVDKAVDQFQR
jgi:hypothetical protein